MDEESYYVNLIECVSEEKCLYDSSNRVYSDKYERNRAWHRISSKLGKSREDCERRWHLLREKYVRELRRREALLKTGVVDDTNLWPFFGHMFFLKAFIKPRKRKIISIKKEAENFIENLIESVKEETCLYSKSNILYYDKNKKDAAWDRISNRLGETKEKCERRWNILRDRFTRELGAPEEILENETIYTTSWPYFEQLLFLKDNIKKRSIHENMNFKTTSSETYDDTIISCSNVDENSTSQNMINSSNENEEYKSFSNIINPLSDGESSDVIETTPASTRKRKTKESPSDDDSEVVMQFKSAVELFKSKITNVENDEDEIFMKNIITMMKPIPLKGRDEIKMKIFNLVMEERKKLY